jgi:peptidoglycan hydrolase-like protein with peptidoglycan-binding domain
MRGEDVAPLHAELAQLRAGALDAEVASDEVERRFFGPTTREAVAAFQGQHGLAATGEVAEAEARSIN